MRAPIVRLPRVEPLLGPLDPRALAIVWPRIDVRCEDCRAPWIVRGDLADALWAGCPVCHGTLRREAC